MTAYYLTSAERADTTAHYSTETVRLSGTVDGSVVLNELPAGSTTHVWLTVDVEYDNNNLRAYTEGDVVTPEVPILIGKFSITDDDGKVTGSMNWDPREGIAGVLYSSDPYTYWFNNVSFGTGDAFSFVTRLGTADQTGTNAWNTVNSSPRYAPSNSESTDNRAPAPLGEWFPYTEFTGGTSNAWVPSTTVSQGMGETTTKYTILFSYGSKQVMILTDVATAVPDIAVPESERVNVYSLLGSLVKSNVDRSSATEGLPTGIYIVGHRKVIVR